MIRQSLELKDCLTPQQKSVVDWAIYDGSSFLTDQRLAPGVCSTSVTVEISNYNPEDKCKSVLLFLSISVHVYSDYVDIPVSNSQ